MIFKIPTILLCLLTSLSLAQEIPIQELTTLSSVIDETSGLIYYNNQVITINDSGSKAALYELDTLTGDVNRVVYISNANNIDWEDLAQDDEYIYIGDFGNNSGTRTNLNILKISKTDYQTTLNDSVSSERIDFSYEDQTSFNPTQFSTNFDAEALVSIDDQLIIFSKNWGDNLTKAYLISKNAGTYSLSIEDSFDIDGLVTSAYYSESKKRLILTTYTSIQVFDNATATDIFPNSSTKYFIEFTGSSQLESICYFGNENYLISTETFANQPATLYKFNLPEVVNSISIDDDNFTIFPNPVDNNLNVYSDKIKFNRIDIIDNSGRITASFKIENSYQTSIIFPSNSGVYLLKITTSDSRIIYRKIIVR